MKAEPGWNPLDHRPRAAGYPLDMRRLKPYCGYEDYDFDVPVYDRSDCYNRLRVRFDECYQSLRIVAQVSVSVRVCRTRPSPRAIHTK